MIFEIIEWLNVNNGFVMALLTLVYVVATVFICCFNHKSAKAAQEQTCEAQKQFILNNKAKVIPKFVTLEGQLYCLAFQNVGHTMADHLNIVISSEWLECLSKTEKNADVAKTLEKLSKLEVFLPEGEQYLYALCVPADGTGDYKKLCEKPLNVTISYTSDGVLYKDNYELSMNGINCLLNTSDYVRLEKKKLDLMKEISKEMTNGKMCMTVKTQNSADTVSSFDDTEEKQYND